MIIMMCDTRSYFPDGIDPMLFFQDNDLEHIDIINNYNKLIALGKYTEANNYIKLHRDVYGYFADYFNAIENRIYNTQKYLSEKKPPKKQYVFFDPTEEQPEPDIEEGMFWL